MVKKIKEEITAEDEVVAEATDLRTNAWLKFVANYATKNPVKYAQKKANGEFDKIPANFK